MLRLPVPATKRLAIRVSKDAERQIRSGHPWVYDQSIESGAETRTQGQETSSGKLAVIFDHNRDFLAIGLLDPDSPIRIKVLHHGKPKSIDRSFWQERIQTAITLREPLRDDPATSAYRLVNGENDGLPGLIVDRYESWLVIKLYSSAWFPHLTSVLGALSGVMQTELGSTPDMVLRLSRNVAQGETFGARDGMVVHLAPSAAGEEDVLTAGPSNSPEQDPPAAQGPPNSVEFIENGLVFVADLLSGQKTGHFLDQRDNRRLVSTLSQGRRVLDVFSCTGGFSLASAAGGAATVHAIDQAPRALDALVANIAKNQSNVLVQQCKFTTAVGDAFEQMEGLATQGRRFDLIIIDPPSFAQKQADISRAQRAYRRLTSLALGVLAPGGILIQASCSSRLSAELFFDGVRESARLNGYDLGTFKTTEHAVDHPATFPQGSYLKAIFAQPVKL